MVSHRRPKGFVLLSAQRTGSSWVQEMLNSHPRISAYTELFLPNARGYPVWEPSDVEFARSYLERESAWPRVLTKHLKTLTYLKQFWRNHERVVGFKFMYRHALYFPEVLPYVALQRISVIHLVRWNLLDVVISEELARRDGVYHAVAEDRPRIPSAIQVAEERRPPRTLTLSPSRVLTRLKLLSREVSVMRAWLRVTGTPTLETRYEDLVSHPESFRRLLAFLGVEQGATELHSALRKVNARPQREVVANYDELRDALVGTRFQAYCSEPGGTAVDGG
jgi:LPS sulfotransferase NodH